MQVCVILCSTSYVFY